jgi:hypothetical protein
MLYWGEVPKKLSFEEWSSITADSAPPGVYQPNMTDEYMQKWKAKYIGGENRRVEIRKTLRGVQLKFIVWPDAVNLLANGTLVFDNKDLEEFESAIVEARNYLEAVNE